MNENKQINPKSKPKESSKKLKRAHAQKLNRRGAKDKYKDWISKEGLAKLTGWAMRGYTDEDIAKMMNIAPCTLYEWKKRYPEIKESLRCAKEVIDFQVEQSLLKRALGYTYEEVTRESQINEDGERVLVVTKKITKEVVPDTTAQIFWLKNRRPDDWREKQEVKADVTTRDETTDAILNMLKQRKIEGEE